MKALDQLDHQTADALETLWLEFKPWTGPKPDMKAAVECAVSFANSEGGVVVFGVADKTVGRSAAIHGAHGYDLDTWRRGIFDATRPNLEVKVTELITPRECRELLGLGESQSARSTASKYLRQWSGNDGFLRREGKGPAVKYTLLESGTVPPQGGK